MPLNVDSLNAGSILVQGSPIVSLYETGSGYCSTQRTNSNLCANGNYSIISGGFRNTTFSCFNTIGGGCFNTTFSPYSTVAGGRCGKAGASGVINGLGTTVYTGGTVSINGIYGPYFPSSSLSGGTNAQFTFGFTTGTLDFVSITYPGANYVAGDTLTFDGSLFGGASGTDDVLVPITSTEFTNYGTVGGGRENTASGEYSTISGGYENTASAYASTISGGYQNEVRCAYATVSGGYRNSALGVYSTISGGYCNTTSACYSTISGGYSNTVSGYASTISGGQGNTISGAYSIIGNGFGNTITSYRSVVNGGTSNTVIGNYSSILGGFCNSVTHVNAHIIGCGLTSTADNTLHINCLHFGNIPTSSVGLAPGTVWNDSGMLCIV